MKKYPVSLTFRMQFKRELTAADKKKLNDEIQRFLRRIADCGYEGSQFGLTEYQAVELPEKSSLILPPGSAEA